MSRCRIPTCCLVYHIPARPLRYRPSVDPTRVLTRGLSMLDILCERFADLPGVSSRVVICADDERAPAVGAWAEAHRLATVIYSADEARNKPLRLSQERWALEADRGHDDLPGAVLARVSEQQKAGLILVISTENPAVDRESVQASLQLQFREEFDYLWSYDRLSGANWMILKAEMLAALQKHHSDILSVKGGLVWALQKPLYPFRAGEYHAPRASPSLQADLRHTDARVAAILAADGSEEGLGGRRFQYERWVSRVDWADAYTDVGPQVVKIEPTNRCQASCQACPHGKMSRLPVNLEPEIWRVLIDGLKSTGCRWEFSGLGEPLLHPELDTMLGCLAGRHVKLETSLQVDPGTAFPFAALDLVSLSVDACDAARFAELRAGCSWERLERFIGWFAEKKQAQADDWPELGVTLLKHQGNADLDLTFLHYWKKVVTPVFRTDFFQWPLEEPPAQVQWFQIRGASDYLDFQPYPARTRYVPMKRRACRHALLNLHVLADGRVSICPYDVEGRWILGDLHRQSPLEIWRSETARAFRRQHLEQTWSDAWPCRTCQDWYHP